MAGLSPAMPEPHPELHAALVLNMAFSIGTLVLLSGGATGAAASIFRHSAR